jgi:hypothetical protein
MCVLQCFAVEQKALWAGFVRFDTTLYPRLFARGRKNRLEVCLDDFPPNGMKVIRKRGRSFGPASGDGGIKKRVPFAGDRKD